MSARSGERGAGGEPGGGTLADPLHSLHDRANGAEQRREQMRVARRPASPDVAAQEGVFLGTDAQGDGRDVELAPLRDRRVRGPDRLVQRLVELRCLQRQADEPQTVVRHEKVVHAIERLHRAREKVAVTGPAVVGPHLFDRLACGEGVVPAALGERLLHVGAQAVLQAVQSLCPAHVTARTEHARTGEEQRKGRRCAQRP